MSVWRRFPSRSERITLSRHDRTSSSVSAGAENWTSVAHILREHELQEVQPSVWSRPASQPAVFAGTWFVCHQPASIAQHGDHLIFTNELGQRAEGRMLDSARLIADGWGGLVGLLSQATICWDNDTVWDRVRYSPPCLHGTWSHANESTQIRQTGDVLTFINERGESSTGRFLGRGQILATDWSDLRGSIVDDSTIHWSNSSTWIRC